MPSAEEPEYSPASNANREIERLQKQHAWMRKCLDGKFIFAPIDTKKPDLKVLDIGCADGKPYTPPFRPVRKPPNLNESLVHGMLTTDRHASSGPSGTAPSYC